MTIQKQDHDPKLIALVAAAQEYRESIEEAKTAVLASVKGNELAVVGITEATRRLTETGNQVSAAARAAVQDVARNEATTLAAPLQHAVQEAMTAAKAASSAATSVKWVWALAAFAFGVLVGAGGLYAYMSTRPPLYGVSVDDVIKYVSEQAKSKSR